MVLTDSIAIMFVGLVTTEKESKGSLWDVSKMCTFDLGVLIIFITVMNIQFYVHLVKIHLEPMQFSIYSYIS